MGKEIEIKNARVHNLKGVDVNITRNQLIVVTGPSGSGKSSLAFDTLYAEGQRRYVESLSSYVRQFLGRMNKPEVDYINGLPPAVAIQQKVISNNPRSTVGTATEIYEYLKLLFARIGKTISPISGIEVKRERVADVVDYIVSLPTDTVAYLLSPIKQDKMQSIKIDKMMMLTQQGYSRIAINNEFFRISDIIERLDKKERIKGRLSVLIERIKCQDTQEIRNRLADSVQTAFSENPDKLCTVLHQDEKGKMHSRKFSEAFEADGITFEEPSSQMFAFNSPAGACPQCNGDGFVTGIDPKLVIPDPTLSVFDNAVACWRGEMSKKWKEALIHNASQCKFPIHKPINELSEKEYDMLWRGTEFFKGIDQYFEFVASQQAKIQYRVILSRYRGRTICRACGGTRLRKDATYVKVGGMSITQLVQMPINELQQFFSNLQLTEYEQTVSKRLLVEINNRLGFLVDVGLGYLTLSRSSATLSGGESQRINLATSLGSALVGSLYVLDEPSIGLHPRDTERLINVLHQLRDIGNTVVVVEHDNEIIQASDQLIDIGPAAGRLGGEVVWQGPIDTATKADLEKSVTLRYLKGKEQIPVPTTRRKWHNYIDIIGCSENNLKNINVQLPLGVLTVVTGVSGSGKSTLVRDIIYRGIKQRVCKSCTVENPGAHHDIKGSLHLLDDVQYVSQKPIGKSLRSNPATYIKAYDEIRRLFADQPLAKQLQFTAGDFSFNHDGGRCEICQGEGTVTVPMQFMADLTIECEACHGKRFKQDILDVLYRGKSVYDVLEMTINQAIEFFSESPGLNEQRIVTRLKHLQDVGIGYLQMGQSSSTLSGGENQRVKLAEFLSNESSKPTLFVFDEPTTGLHACDIKKLLDSFNALIDHGHTVLVIEHNCDVIKCADHIIDLGPEGGKEGGEIVCTGTPEEIISCKKSLTAKYLKPYLKNKSR